MRKSRVLRAVVLVAVSAISVSACVIVRPPPSSPAPRATIVTFYDALAPHGEWIFISGFGRVWRPWRQEVGIGFVPYASGGRWEYTEVGWVFESDWPWAGIVFHYGRWFYLDGQGWLWFPDTVWGPAWVDWRYGGGYVCWVPLPPPHVTAVVVAYRPVWYVVPTRYFPHGGHSGHFVPEHEASPIVAQAAPIPARPQPRGESWHVGPPPRAVAAAANLEVRPRPVDRPAPLPGTALEVPRNARITQLPPPRPPAGEPGPRVAPPPPIEPEPRVTPPARVAPAGEKRPPPKVEPPRKSAEPPAAPPRVQPPSQVKPVVRPEEAKRPARRAAPPEKKEKEDKD
jgi:hypothetical protein